MRKLILIPILLFLGCKKQDSLKTITATYYVIAHLGTNEMLAIQYISSYSALKYGGSLIYDTLNTDTFRITVTYEVNDTKMKGEAGYLTASMIIPPNTNYNNTFIQEVGAIVNGGYVSNNHLTYSYNSPPVYTFNSPSGKGYQTIFVDW